MEFTINALAKESKNQNGFKDVIYLPIDIEIFPDYEEVGSVYFYNQKTGKQVMKLTTDEIRLIHAYIESKEKRQLVNDLIKTRK